MEVAISMTIEKAIKFINELTDVIPDDCSDSEICKKSIADGNYRFAESAGVDSSK